MFQFYVNSKNESLEKEYQSTKGFFCNGIIKYGNNN